MPHTTTPDARDERRRRRSSIPTESLRWLLEAQRERGALDAVTLATDDGLPVASAGDDGETLAALAPSLARGACDDALGLSLEGVTVHTFSVLGQPLHLALRGGDRSLHPALAQLGAQGAARILGA
jgi:hypothetical protein